MKSLKKVKFNTCLDEKLDKLLQLKPTEIKIILALYKKGVDGASSPVTLNELEKLTNLARPTIVKNIKTLEKSNHIKKTYTLDGNIYKLCI